MMKRVKSWRMFLEDGVAAANASTTAGMGGVSNAVVGGFAGVGGESGSGDSTSYLGAESSKKGDPSEVSDLRYLEDEETQEVDDLKSVRKKSK